MRKALLTFSMLLTSLTTMASATDVRSSDNDDRQLTIFDFDTTALQNLDIQELNAVFTARNGDFISGPFNLLANSTAALVLGGGAIDSVELAGFGSRNMTGECFVQSYKNSGKDGCRLFGNYTGVSQVVLGAKLNNTEKPVACNYDITCLA